MSTVNMSTVAAKTSPRTKEEITKKRKIAINRRKAKELRRVALNRHRDTEPRQCEVRMAKSQHGTNMDGQEPRYNHAKAKGQKEQEDYHSRKRCAKIPQRRGDQCEYYFSGKKGHITPNRKGAFKGLHLKD